MNLAQLRTLSNHAFLPALAAGVIAWLGFVGLGHTPFIRAAGLALTIVAVTLTLQRFGSLLAMTGGLALAFSSAFWSQTGGPGETNVILIAAALAAALLVIMALIVFGQRPALALGVGIVIFALLFWTLVGTPRSLRITILLSAWVLYLLLDMLFITHPRAEEGIPAQPSTHHTLGLLLLLTVGVLNDPLFILLVPAVLAGLLLAGVRLSPWYWMIMALIAVIGARGAVLQYLDSGWWLFPAERAEELGIQVPYVMADGWREGTRWIKLFDLITTQFSALGLVLGLVGLSRLSRWYPALGEVTILAYATYALFGLVYFGKDSLVLMLPLLMVQVIWMTYAVHTITQWLQKSSQSPSPLLRWLAPAAFTLLPLVMVLRIAGIL